MNDDTKKSPIGQALDGTLVKPAYANVEVSKLHEAWKHLDSAMKPRIYASENSTIEEVYQELIKETRSSINEARRIISGILGEF